MTLILTQHEVRELLDMPRCMDVMRDALATLAGGNAVNPLRSGIRVPNTDGLLGMMPGYLSDPPALGIKVVAVFPHNHGTEYDSHQGLVILFALDHGTPLAIMDASEITAIRTAAVTGVATRLLANEDASVLAILGSGIQARRHLEAMAIARPLTSVRIYSPTKVNRESFAAEATDRFSFPIVATQSAQDAIEGADIVCTTTSSSEPVLLGEWVSNGCHINAVGSSVKWARELDGAAVAMSRLFVDRRESTVSESGDYLSALKEGAIAEDHIVGEVGDIIIGTLPGRESTSEVTLFKSLGLAVEDLAAAHHVYIKATERGMGTHVELGGKA